MKEPHTQARFMSKQTVEDMKNHLKQYLESEDIVSIREKKGCRKN